VIRTALLSAPCPLVQNPTKPRRGRCAPRSGHAAVFAQGLVAYYPFNENVWGVGGWAKRSRNGSNRWNPTGGITW
jgi:hypothetical protein